MKGNMYNRKHGENPHADELLAMINLKREDFGRYRDTYLNADGTSIVVLTRCGGENRPYFTQVFAMLKNHPQAYQDNDDEFDKTYCYIRFRVKPSDLERTRELATGEELTIRQKTEALMRETYSMTREQMMNDPRFADDFKIMQSLANSNAPITRLYDDDMPEHLQV